MWEINLLAAGEIEGYSNIEKVYEDCGGKDGLLEFAKDEFTYEDQNLVNLLFRQNMSTPKTKCGKLCNAIIDGWSYENLISQEMVTKLNLEVQLHLKPHRTAWFKKGDKVKLTH